MLILAFILSFTLTAPLLCKAQVNEVQAKVMAADAVKSALKFNESKLLRVHRREDLEDDLFGLQIKIIGKIAKAAFFYEVSENGYFVVSSENAVSVNSVDGSLKWLVAISTKTGQPYHLYGFENAFLEFNRLAKDAGLQIASEADAVQYAFLFNKLVNDLDESKLVLSLRQMKHKAEDYYFAKYSEPVANKLFKARWSGFLSHKHQIKPGASSKKAKDGYNVTFTFLTSKDGKSLQLQACDLTIFPTGAESLVAIRAIYSIQ